MIVPFLHRVIVKPEAVDETDEVIRRAKAAGIQVQLDKREQAAVEIGTVVALGDTFGADYKTTVLPKVGEKIYFAKYAGKTIKDGEQELLCLNDEDVVCIIREEV